VGISADAKFTTAKFQLQTGDVLVGYTDGISDVQNYHGEVWGVPAFEKLLRSCACAGPKEIIERTLDGAAGFANGQPQTDDMTLLVLMVEEECHEWGQLPRAYEQSPSLCEPRLRTV
jgi:sigma-B regulation protein RsbU (phosphoserine phosphatase)